MILRALTFALSLSLASYAGAETKRQLDAHEHGHGNLNIAVDGKDLALELKVPGADIVGFEYMPKSKEDKAKLAAAKKTLETVAAVFTLPVSAQCAKRAVEVEYETDDHAGHDKHGHKKKHDHGHKEKHAHKHDHGHKHEKHGHHDKHKAEKEESHAEFHVTYKYRCDNIAALNSIGFPYFKTFNGAEELTVTLVSKKGQKVFEVKRPQESIDLQGMM